jgi:hypothetical protein
LTRVLNVKERVYTAKKNSDNIRGNVEIIAVDFVCSFQSEARKKFLNFKFYRGMETERKSEKQQQSAMSSAIHLTS